MKRLLSILMISMLVMTGCSQGGGEAGSSSNSAPVDVRVIALKGPTGMGLAGFMSEEESVTKNNFSFELTGAVDEIAPKIVQGQVDIAAVPANLASVLYNNTEGEVQVLAVNTLGVLYIVENGETIQSLADLKGQTIFASGKGATPEYSLNYLLEKAGLDPATDVQIEWKAEHAEVVAAMAAETGSIGLLPQPFVTVAQSQNENLRIAIDLNQAWEDLNEDSGLITGVFVVRKEFAEANPDAVAEFLTHYSLSQEMVNENTEEVAALMEEFDIIKAAVAAKAIPYCNIVSITGSEMKTILEGYLNILMDANPKAVGGQLPDENFYYIQAS